jgi:hypothetical protein
MLEVTLLSAAIGAVFILIGAWLYSNPRRLIFGFGMLNRDPPGVQRVARAYATFFIFFGAFALSAIATVRLLPGVPGTPILGLAAAIALTWFLRSRLKRRLAVTTSPAIVSEGQVAAEGQFARQPLLNLHWKRGLLIAIGFVVVLLVVVMGVLGSSDISKLAFSATQASQSVKQRLGEPIKRGFFISGSIEESGPSGKADIAIPISGPKAKATVFAVARKSAGIWQFETLQVSFNEGGQRQDLLEEAVGSGTR